MAQLMKLLQPHQQGDFLPDLCTVQAVFHLVLVGELLAFALALAKGGVLPFDWYQLGVLSMLVQWIVLTSAACLCPLRPWLRRTAPLIAGAASFSLVLAICAFYTFMGHALSLSSARLDWNLLFTNFLLAALFAGIVLRYFYLQQQLRNQQQAELNARIQALQSRIRPHFLFNSMNSIASLIDFDPEAAERMVVDLSELFRASLSEPGLIPLKREVELCERFVGIEQARIGDRLRVEWHCDFDETAEIPSLMLQPLIENAIYHGIQPRTEGGVLRVKVVTKGPECFIEVDNPVGDKDQATKPGNGMALNNIRHRLDAYYGTKGSLKTHSDPEHYRVEIRFPAHRIHT